MNFFINSFKIFITRHHHHHHHPNHRHRHFDYHRNLLSSLKFKKKDVRTTNLKIEKIRITSRFTTKINKNSFCLKHTHINIKTKICNYNYKQTNEKKNENL